MVSPYLNSMFHLWIVIAVADSKQTQSSLLYKKICRKPWSFLLFLKQPNIWWQCRTDLATKTSGKSGWEKFTTINLPPRYQEGQCLSRQRGTRTYGSHRKALDMSWFKGKTPGNLIMIFFKEGSSVTFDIVSLYFRPLPHQPNKETRLDLHLGKGNKNNPCQQI